MAAGYTVSYYDQRKYTPQVFQYNGCDRYLAATKYLAKNIVVHRSKLRSRTLCLAGAACADDLVSGTVASTLRDCCRGDKSPAKSKDLDRQHSCLV